MRFLIDADLPRDIATLLSSYGHIAIDSRDIGMRYAADLVIAEYARTHELCIVTGDWGFSDIRTYPPEKYPGIVVLGLPAHATRPMFLRTLRQLLDRADLVESIRGRLTIVEKSRIRMRPSA